jgi:hypothetical protein
MSESASDLVWLHLHTGQDCFCEGNEMIITVTDTATSNRYPKEKWRVAKHDRNRKPIFVKEDNYTVASGKLQVGPGNCSISARAQNYLQQTLNHKRT